MKQQLIGVIVCLAAVAGWAAGNSSYVDVDSTQYDARDIGTGQIYMEGGFTVNNGVAHYWSGGSYYTCDLATGTITDIGAPTGVFSNGYGDPCGAYDSTTDTFYAMTYYGAGDSYIYKYQNGIWSDPVQAVNIYGSAIYNGEVYLSGLREPWSGGYDSSYISVADLTGNGYHDALVETGGASAHVAVDNAGNVYYTPYTTTGSSALYRWSAEQLAGARNDLASGETDTYLMLEDGEKLTDLPGGGNGIVVDDAGHVFVTTNAYPDSGLFMWNGTSGDGENYELIAMNREGGFAWFGPLDIEGDFLAGDALYGSYGYYGPITEIICIVPEPATLALLGLGAMMSMCRRKK